MAARASFHPDYIIDGYNVIYADEDLRALREHDIESARDALVARVLDFCAREGTTAEIVFDAAGKPGKAASEDPAPVLRVTYTAANESADDFIEKMIYRVRPREGAARFVVTADYAQQRIALGAGMLRMSSREFLLRLAEQTEEVREKPGRASSGTSKVTVSDRLSDDVKAALERFKRPPG
jgi:predicted RNA-binding protein with PIN domain